MASQENAAFGAMEMGGPAPERRDSTLTRSWNHIERKEGAAANLVSRSNRTAVGTGKRQSLAQLLYDPVAGRMFRDVEV